MNKIKQAMLFAEFVHSFQLRQDGEPYINHIIRVSEAVEKIGGNENLIIAAILHDTIEDSKSPHHIACIIEEEFGTEISEVVNILTHKKGDLYNEYISKIFKHSVAWIIKFEDLKDNISYSIPEKQKTKYRDACIHLMAHGVTVPDVLKERLEI
jgi:hypothetical protein